MPVRWKEIGDGIQIHLGKRIAGSVDEKVGANCQYHRGDVHDDAKTLEIEMRRIEAWRLQEHFSSFTDMSPVNSDQSSERKDDTPRQIHKNSMGYPQRFSWVTKASSFRESGKREGNEKDRKYAFHFRDEAVYEIETKLTFCRLVYVLSCLRSRDPSRTDCSSPTIKNASFSSFHSSQDPHRAQFE